MPSMSLSDYAKTIHAEALRRAVMQSELEGFLNRDELTPAKIRDLRLMLARKYDRLIDEYRLDTHERLEETVAAQYPGYKLKEKTHG